MLSHASELIYSLLTEGFELSELEISVGMTISVVQLCLATEEMIRGFGAAEALYQVDEGSDGQPVHLNYLIDVLVVHRYQLPKLPRHTISIRAICSSDSGPTPEAAATSSS